MERLYHDDYDERNEFDNSSEFGRCLSRYSSNLCGFTDHESNVVGGMSHTIFEATEILFTIMARKKSLENVPRPHYTVFKKRHSVLKEHPLGPYATENRKCRHCGTRRTDLL